MDSATLTVSGILIGILLFGLKTGVGCGFSNLRSREILAIGGSYFLLSLLFGSLTGSINMKTFEEFMGMGMSVHVFLSLLLIGSGIYTQKKWSSGQDVSKRTFLFISLPCPVCMAALALSCMLLSENLGFSGIKTGFMVGTAFFIAVVASSFLFKKMGRAPQTLGSIMMMLGIYYLLGALLVPAYMQTKQMGLVSTGGGEFEIFPLLVCGLIILASFFLANLRRHNQ